jgi:ABC-type Fe3+-siderophore transport system permease subunit
VGSRGAAVRSALANYRFPLGPRGRLALGAVLLLALAFLLSPTLGQVPIPAVVVYRIILGLPNPCAGFRSADWNCAAAPVIVLQVRLPEILLALIAGAALGLSGAGLQGVFRNPLADPFLLGLSSGATLGASVVFVYQVGIQEADLALPFFAFLGAGATGAIVVLLARSRQGSVETLLLAGVAIASFLSAADTLVILSNQQLGIEVYDWLLGGLGQASWPVDAIALGLVAIFGTFLALYGPELNLLQLGSDVAQSVGVNASRVRISVITLATLITAVAVAFTGIIGFVGLVAPHIIRRTVGTDYRVVLGGSALTGAAFLLIARDASDVVFPTSVLPIGIFTSLIGVPFFLYLLYRESRRVTMGAA